MRLELARRSLRERCNVMAGSFLRSFRPADITSRQDDKINEPIVRKRYRSAHRLVHILVELGLSLNVLSFPPA